jgi:hypothetical protein
LKRGQIKPGSIRHRVTEFFDRNPTEELTLDDLQAKFGIESRKVASNAVCKLRANGDIEVVYLIRRGSK